MSEARRVPSLLDQDETDRSDSAQQMVSDVAEHGFHVITVYPFAETPPEWLAWEHVPAWSYTVGLYLSYGHPELTAFAIDGETAHAVFWDLARGIKSGRRFEAGHVYVDALPSFDGECAFEGVNPGWAQSLFAQAAWFYLDRSFPILQYVWPDRDGHWVWEEAAADPIRSAQPDLTQPPASDNAPPVLPRA